MLVTRGGVLRIVAFELAMKAIFGFVVTRASLRFGAGQSKFIY